MNKIKGNKAITLIALIITIIVLLILAGVVINMTVGNNGIIAKSQVATQKYKEAAVKEQLEILMAEAKLKAMDEKQDFTVEYFKTYLETKLGNKVQAQIDESGVLHVTIDGFTFSFSSINGNITMLSNYTVEKETLTEEKMLTNLGIEGTTHEEILANTDGVLDTIFSNKEATEFIINNYNEYKDITETESGMTALASSEKASYQAVTEDNWRNKILTSPYANIFDEHAIKVPIGVTTNLLASADLYNNNYPSSMAFDSWTNDTWFNSENDGKVPKYLGYDFGQDLIIYKMVWNTRGGTHNSIKLQGCNFKDWEDIQRIDMPLVEFNSNNITAGNRSVAISSNKSYIKFRIYASESSQLNQNGGLSVQILQFYCVKAQKTDDEIATRNIIINKDGILDGIFSDKTKTKEIINNFSKYKDIVNNEAGMTALASSEIATYEAFINDNWRNEILTSAYVDILDEYAIKVPIGVTSNIIAKEGDRYNANMYPPSDAFDSWSNDTWSNSANDGQVPKYLGYDFGENLIIYKVLANTRGNSHSSVQLQGASNDTWSDIQRIEIPAKNFSNISSGNTTHIINSKTPYSKFRLLASSSSQLNSYGGFSFEILQFYCIKVK